MEPLAQDQTHAEAPRRSSFGRVVLWLLIVAACAAGFFAWRRYSTQAASAAQTDAPQDGNRGGGARRGGRGGGGGVVPVVATLANKQDLPVYLSGLGSVVAYNTVTVKTRLDGPLVEVDFKEGQDVNKGDLLAVIDRRPYQVALSQAQANLAKDQAQMEDAKRNKERDLALVAQGVIPQQQSDTQAALADQLQGAVQADQAAVDNAKLNLVYCDIISPIGGRVGLRLVDAGNMVHASDANGLLVITQVEPIAVVFTLPEDNLPAVVARTRAGATLPVLAMSRDSGTQLASGTLATIDNQIDQTTGTFKLKAVFDNKDRSLWPNQFINARLLLDTKRGATIIPVAAVQTGTQGSFVYVVKPDSTVQVRPITVGITEGDVASIDAGLAPGEQVVTDGQDRLRDGVTVDARTDTGLAAQPAASASQQGDSGRRNAQGGQQAGADPQGSRQGNRKRDRQGSQTASGGSSPTS